MIELTVYRHKTDKDVYLARNWSFCGGNENTDFYYATTDINEAFIDANRENFLSWYHRFENLKAKITKIMDFEWDGYAGKLTKDLVYCVSDFEKVVLTEKDGDSNDE